MGRRVTVTGGYVDLPPCHIYVASQSNLLQDVQEKAGQNEEKKKTFRGLAGGSAKCNSSTLGHLHNYDWRSWPAAAPAEGK